MADVIIVMGSKSDEKIAEKAKVVLEEFGVDYAIEVASAHRNPEKVKKLATESGAKVFIAIAGLSAALPGVVAAHTTRPVIGVPVNSKLDGLDALLSIAQMPPGIPVGCVGIDNAKNAALLAISILSVSDPGMEKKIQAFREKMKG